MKYKVLFWDLDGTITDSLLGVANALDRVFDYFNIEIDRNEYRKFVGPPLRTSFPPYFGVGERLETALQIFREYYVTQGLFEVSLFDGVKDTLIALKERGYRLFVATSKGEDTAKRLLDKLELLDCFEKVFGANDRIGIREKEDVLNKAFNEYTFNKEECLMIGDTMYDVRGAEYIGIDCLAVLYGFGDSDELLASNIIGSVDNVQDLLNIL